MTIFTGAPRLEPEAGTDIDRLDVSMGESLGAAAASMFNASPVMALSRVSELSEAMAQPERTPLGGELGLEDMERPSSLVPIAAARARVKEAGLDKTLTLPERPDIPEGALTIMMNRARERREREATLARGPEGFVSGALHVGTSFLVSAVDPINIASAFIPVVGEARYGKLLANAGAGAISRAVLRARVGALEGAVGAALVEPLEVMARTQEGQDYAFSEFLQQIVFGAGLGAGLHTGLGAIADWRAGRAPVDVYNVSVASASPAAARGYDEAIDPLDAPAAAPEPGPSVRATDAVGDEGAPGSVSARQEPPAGEIAKPAEGFVRFYHGGEDPTSGGGRWVTPHLDYARGYAGSSPVHYVDIPADSPLLKKSYDDTGADWPAPFVHFEAPAELAAQLRVFEPGKASLPAALDDLPPRAKEDAMRVAIADLTQGRPVSAGDVLAAAGESDPRIAVSLSAARNDWPALIEGGRIAGHGPNGPVVEGYRDRWQEAISWLRQAQTGDVVGVLEHPDVPGRIDVIWGDRAKGLAHIDGKHPGDADRLPDLWSSLKPTSISDKYIVLESPQAVAVIAADFRGEAKTWMLTFYQRRDDARPAGETVRSPGDYGPAAQSPASPRDDNLAESPAAVESAAWRELAGRPQDDEVPPPAGPEPSAIAPEATERVQAAERAAAEAEAEYQAHAPYLPEDLKQRVDDDVKALDQEAADRADVLRRGAACLVAGSGD